MKLTITEAALKRIESYRENDQVLVIFYDTEDCGCGVNGVPALRLTKVNGEHLQPIECEGIPVFVHRQQSVFLEESMTLDFADNRFRLSSPNGMLNGFIPESSLLSEVDM